MNSTEFKNAKLLPSSEDGQYLIKWVRNNDQDYEYHFEDAAGKKHVVKYMYRLKSERMADFFQSLDGSMFNQFSTPQSDVINFFEKLWNRFNKWQYDVVLPQRLSLMNAHFTETLSEEIKGSTTTSESGSS